MLEGQVQEVFTYLTNMKTFTFSVPASLIYNIEATTEKEAYKILLKEGGLNILADDTIVDVDDYEIAECVDVRN